MPKKTYVKKKVPNQQSRNQIQRQSNDSQSSQSNVAAPQLQDKCKQNYRNSYKLYDRYFMKCLEEIEDLQPSGFACIQVSRYFTVGVLPKNCIIPDPLTRKERTRVERLLAD